MNGRVALEGADDGIHCSNCTLGTSPKLGYDGLPTFSEAPDVPCNDIPLTFSSLVDNVAYSHPASPQQALFALALPQSQPNQLETSHDNSLARRRLSLLHVKPSLLTSTVLLI